jgi:predicted DNA-binding WGR domain protein
MMPSIYLERREPAHNRQRFYAITVTRTLFDRWAVIREWGRIGQPGTVRETWFETEGEAWAAGEHWRQRKEKRGYRAVGGFSQAGTRDLVMKKASASVQQPAMNTSNCYL